MATVDIPPRGTRGVRIPKMPGPLMRFANDMAFRLLKARPFRGAPGVLSLQTIGAKSGQPRRNTLAYFHDTDTSWLIVASGGGTATHPAWLYNLAKHPDQVSIEIRGKRLKVTPETLKPAERQAAWQRIISQAPAFKSYETTTDREIPVIRLKAL